MLELEPPRHTRLRGLVLRAFTSRRIAALAPEIAQLCHDLIDALARRASSTCSRHFGQRLPVIVIARLLGVPEDDVGRPAALVERDGRHVSGGPHPRDRGSRRAPRPRPSSPSCAAYVEARRTDPPTT